MALLFRINVISKRLTSICCSFTQPFFGSSPQPRRYLFTNSCSVYFAKKKVDEVKTPKCPDFEQFFTKTKKSEFNKNGAMYLGKTDDERPLMPLIQPPIFGDKTASQPRPLAEKKTIQQSIFGGKKMNSGNFFPTKVPKLIEKKQTAAEPSSDKTIPSSPSTVSKSQTSDKKSSLKKSLNDFEQFKLPLKSLATTNSSAESRMPQKKESDPSPQSHTKDDSKTNEKTSDASSDRISKKNTNFNWLAAIVIAAATAMGFALRARPSSTDVPLQNSIMDEIVITEAENDECPLVLPKKVPYLIIGGGTASWSAFKAIKEHVPNAKVLVVSNETYRPYMRASMLKFVRIENSAVQKVQQLISLEASDFYTDPMKLLGKATGGISILSNRTAKHLKLCERKLVLTDGTEIEYDECLLATGSKPQNLPIFQTAPHRIRNKISFFRSFDDFQSVKDIVDKSESVAVIGGGFLASEIALVLATANTKTLKVYQIFHENGNMGLVLPNYLSDWIKKKFTDYGLFVIPNTQVESVHMEKSKLKLGLLSGELLVVDHVIVALGSEPDFAFAQMSGLKLGNRGIVVNEKLEALPHLYVAGDAASIRGRFGKETELSHDHAVASGRLAGENMAGKKKSFIHHSYYHWEVAPGMTIQSVGMIDSALKTVGVFFNGSDHTTNVDNTNKGVVFYMKNDKVVGILLWNILNKMNIARQVIAEGTQLYDLNEVARRFEIQE